MNTLDGISVNLLPLSVPLKSIASLFHVAGNENKSCEKIVGGRFRPFGYKEIRFTPSMDQIVPPAQISWPIPTRYQSLSEIKFVKSMETQGIN